MNPHTKISVLIATTIVAAGCISLPSATSSPGIEVVPDSRVSLSAHKARDGQTLVIRGLIRSRTGRGGVSKGHIHIVVHDATGKQISEAVKYHPALGMRRRAPRQIRFSERFPGAPPDALVRVERHSASESCKAESEH